MTFLRCYFFIVLSSSVHNQCLLTFTSTTVRFVDDKHDWLLSKDEEVILSKKDSVMTSEKNSMSIPLACISNNAKNEILL